MGFDQPTSEAYAANLGWWNTLAKHHANGAMDTQAFLDGKYQLHEYLLSELGDIDKKSLLHLQCHTGMDTLALARLGAKVTGVDFSDEAINEARQLANRADIDASFHQANVVELGDRFTNQFDIVFTSYGVTGWLHDLEPWGNTIASSLKSNGVFYIAEFHPYMLSLNDLKSIDAVDDLRVLYPYFNTGQPFHSEPEYQTDYADPNFKSEEQFQFWQHSLGEIIGSLTNSGLVVEYFAEHDFCADPNLPGMIKDESGFFRLPDHLPKIPFMYSIRARKI